MTVEKLHKFVCTWLRSLMFRNNFIIKYRYKYYRGYLNVRSSLDICIQLVSHTYIYSAIFIFRCVSFIWVYVYNIYQRPPVVAGEQRHTMGRNCRGHNRLIIINRMAPTEPAQCTATPQPPPEKSQKGSGTGRPNHWYSPLADPGTNKQTNKQNIFNRNVYKY